MKALVKIKGLLILALLWGASLGSFDAYGQCSQNNIIVTGYQLRNEFGEVFSVTDHYQIGEAVAGELWVNFGGSTTNGYNLTMYYDVYKNGVMAADDQVDCMYSGVQIQQNVWTKVRDFNWNWGDVIQIKDIFMYWETGTAKPNTTCNLTLKNNINAQCYSNPEGFTAAVPLFPKFDFQTNGICNTSIQFTSQTIGGTPPFNYTFSWDFDGLGTATGSNPLFTFPGTGTYTIGLTANDGVSITTIYKDIFIDPNFGIQVDIFPTKINDQSGIIYVQSVTGGTPPYSYSWTGPNGFSSNSKDIFGLADGLYTLVVTDANGCQQTEQYVLDIASVLRFDWKTIDLSDQNNEISIKWEVHSELAGSKYWIERSLGNADDFEKIGEITDVKTSESAIVYEYKDNSFPLFEKNIYYRITKIIGSFKFYSPVKLVQRENSIQGNKWIVYPNPSLNSNAQLINPNLDPNQNEEIILELINSGNFSERAEIKLQGNRAINLKEVFGDFPKGILYLRIIQGEKVEIVRIINSN